MGDVETLDAETLNRATLARQMLLTREPIGVIDAVRRLAAVQAQEPASPYLALWNRVDDFDAAQLDSAFADRAVVKASLLRITLHAVDAEDYAAFHRALVETPLRASRLFDRRFTSTGLTADDLDALTPDMLAFAGEARSGAELAAMVDERLGVEESTAFWALRTFAPLHHAPTGPPWSFGPKPQFIAAPSASPTVTPLGRVEAIGHLFVRYLAAFGPASTADFCQFTMLRQPAVREAVAGIADQLVEYRSPAGKVLLDVEGGAIPAFDAPAAPRLLGMWDSTLLAYADRSRVIPEEYRATIIRRNGDTLPTLLVDGHVAGVWRAVDDGIEATAFRRLSEDQWAALHAEAQALIDFLADRQPDVYRRYRHWWDKGIPGDEVRVLGQ
ncbi:MAG: winged helix DNA-binding domain-containing protein [Ilumatobacteraceae bacterium]